jgi:hypothetical protein
MSTAQTIEKLINKIDIVSAESMVTPWVSFIMIFYSS